MYGTRDAGMLWEMVYTEALKDMGFARGVTSPCCFFHEAWGGVSVVVHGDDFTALGTSEGLGRYEQGMAAAFDCKLKGRLGPEEGDLKEVRVLNRILQITSRGIHYEADPRHVELLSKALGLDQGAKSAVTPGIKPTYQQDADPEENLEDISASIMVVKKKTF